MIASFHYKIDLAYIVSWVFKTIHFEYKNESYYFSLSYTKSSTSICTSG